jgi:hypothetical protein
MVDHFDFLSLDSLLVALSGWVEGNQIYPPEFVLIRQAKEKLVKIEQEALIKLMDRGHAKIQEGESL